MSVDEPRNTYLVLGASSDMGIALLADILAKEKSSLVFAHYRSSAEKINQLVVGPDNEVITIQADLSDPLQTISLIDEVKKRCDAPTRIVFFPAAKMAYGRFKEFDWRRFSDDFEIQVHALVEICKAFLPTMAKRKNHDKLVLILSSVTKGSAPKFLSHYVMVKYAQLGLLRALASEYSPAQVNINAISPSMVETRFLDEVDGRLLEMMRLQEENNQFLSVSDVIPMVQFLLSPESDAMQGENVSIENGSAV